MKVLAISLMFNHFHIIEHAWNILKSKSAIANAERLFTKEYNIRYSRTGALFKTPLGTAPKQSRKRALSSIAYVSNNPVAGKLHKKASDYRWSLLAYYVDRSPFSREIKRSCCSKPMLEAISIIDSYRKVNKPLRYSVLDKVMDRLDNLELEQIIDHIISLYNILDYNALIKIYGSWKNALTAFDISAGDEYDFCEEYENFSSYRSMQELTESFVGADIDYHVLKQLNDNDIRNLTRFLHERMNPPVSMIRKFLQLPKARR